jgi:phosphoribosylaminoimidazole-succinocarboxamide synthase
VRTARHLGSGKVRELYEADGRLLLIASDRISAYDVVLEPQIPDKGRVLTGLSQHWFESTRDICPNHFLSVAFEDLPAVDIPGLLGRAMLCRRTEPVPVEFVVRGYLAGSGWRDYAASGGVCGHELPPGLSESERLPRPLLTPATKATSGHDVNISETEAAGIAGPDVYEICRNYALALYEEAAARANERGIIVADTKFEFGLADGEVILIDEMLTPDSSRLWPQSGYRPGGPQPSFDKQYVRDWLDVSGWDHVPPAPALPAEVVDQTRARYVEAFELITGRSLASWVEELR